MVLDRIPPDLVVAWVLSAAAPLAMLGWLRAQERVNREPLAPVLGVFAFGALGATLISTAAEAPLLLAGLIVAATVLAAPIIEECSKLLGVVIVRRRIRELEDGYVYGAAAGLGFAATENALYVTGAYAEAGGGAAIAVLLLRIFTSTFVHAAATGTAGYGYARHRLTGSGILPAFATAVGLHAAFNGLALLTDATASATLLLVLLVVPVVLMHRLKRKIRELDRAGTRPWTTPAAMRSLVAAVCRACGFPVQVPPGLAWECPRCRQRQGPEPAG